MVMAWREFKPREQKTFLKEWHNRQIIKDSPINRDNIMIARAGLFHEGRQTHSLFYDFADGGDLDDYFSSLATKATRNSLKPKYRDIKDESAVRRFFAQIVGLSSALSALHNDLQWSDEGVDTYIKLFHGDLRPANVLVLNEGTPQESWKLHDFGLSKAREDPDRHYNPVFRHLLGPTTKITKQTSSTPRRPEGTYVAPEGQSDRTLSAASDVWSFGCMICLAICFLHNGPDSIGEYQNVRMTLGGDDCFFVKKRKDLKINPGVFGWFDDREKEYRKGHSSLPYLNDRIRSEILPLLKRLLSIKSAGRPNSKKIAEDLKRIQAKLNSNEPKVDRARVLEALGFNRVTTQYLQTKFITGSVRDPPSVWHLNIPDGSNNCKFSPHGHFLAFLSPSGIALYDTASIQYVGTGKVAEPCEDIISPPKVLLNAKWSTFDLSLTHLAAFTTKDPNHVSQPSTSSGFHSLYISTFQMKIDSE